MDMMGTCLRGHANVCQVAERDMKQWRSYLQALYPISLLPFVSWPLPDDLLLICGLQSSK